MLVIFQLTDNLFLKCLQSKTADFFKWKVYPCKNLHAHQFRYNCPRILEKHTTENTSEAVIFSIQMVC